MKECLVIITNMPRHKTDFALGLETILNNPQTSFLKEPKTFNEIHAQSKMSLGAMIKQVGKGSKSKKTKEPTDEEKTKERLAKMEAKSEK